jgi:hypothetical protein
MDINISIRDLIGVLVSLRGSGRKILSQPLGFYRILITAKDGTSPGFMLHAWLDKDQPRQSLKATRDIHSHTFDMSSRVLIGELRNELYSAIEDRDGDHRIARIRQEGPKATRVIVGTTVRVVLDRDETVSAGEIYGFPSKLFHCTVIHSYPTITLMQKERMISDEAVNIIPCEHTDQELGTYVQPKLDQERLWDRILSVLKMSVNEAN